MISPTTTFQTILTGVSYSSNILTCNIKSPIATVAVSMSLFLRASDLKTCGVNFKIRLITAASIKINSIKNTADVFLLNIIETPT